jgi:hypothetical protein
MSESPSAGPMVRVHLEASGESDRPVSQGSPSASPAAGPKVNGTAPGVEMTPVNIRPTGSAGRASTSGLSSVSAVTAPAGPDGIHAQMAASSSPIDTTSPEASLFPGGSQFPLTIPSLQRLFTTEISPAEVSRIIKDEFGGISGLMEKLVTEPTGLDADMCAAQSQSVTERIRTYGVNTLPVAVPKTFLEFCQDVLEDTMLRILMVAAIVSIVLGCVEHPTDGQTNQRRREFDAVFSSACSAQC